jgi:transitional endoplasmic reticulum ATPase
MARVKSSDVTLEILDEEEAPPVKKKRVDDVLIVEHDGPIQLPKGMSLTAAIRSLEQERSSRETVMRVHAPIDGFVPDVAHAFFQALKARYGWVQNKPTPGFFGDSPPVMMTVPTGLNSHVEVPWGRTVVPGIDGYLSPGVEEHESRFRFVLGGEVKRKHEATIKDIVQDTKEFLRAHSVFRAQAFRLKLHDRDGDVLPLPAPVFLDINRSLKDALVLNEDVEYSIRTNVFVHITHRDVMRRLGVSPKRGILLSGRFGTGKSMTSTVVADLATDNGWTYILCERSDELADILRLAREYSPCVVFCEDVDRVMQGQRSVSMDEVLNVLDGVESKNAEIMVILTTNDLHSINQAALRPGRLDAVIEFHPPDSVAVERLMRQYASGLIATTEDITEAADMMAGQIPAVIEEAVKRSKAAAVYRGVTDWGPGTLQGNDLVAAAHTMRNQNRLLEPRVEDTRSDILKAADMHGQSRVQAARILAVNANGIKAE